VDALRLDLAEAHIVTSVPRPEPDGDVRAATGVASRTALVSDALLEPLLVEARDRRASYLDGSFPRVSVLLLLILLCIGWLA